MRSLGIDAGSGSISIALVEDERLVYYDYALHKGKAEAVTKELLEKMEASCPGRVDYGAVNRNGAWIFSNLSEGVLPSFDRVTALLAGVRLLYPQAESVIEIGAQTSCFLTGLHGQEPLQYGVNGECAAGTGAFFEDQMYRLGLPLEEYSRISDQAVHAPRLAGRCSVFAKTDLIHRQQEGVPSSEILLGLAYAVIRNFKGAVVRKMPVKKPVVLTGGVVKNRAVSRAVQEVFGLGADELLSDERGAVAAAAGVAKLALENELVLPWRELVDCGERKALASFTPQGLPPYPFQGQKLHAVRPKKNGERMWLGIDIGSTSTNLVLIGEDKGVLDYQYLRTKGDPLGAAEEGIAHWRREYGKDWNLSGMGVTGSGRYLVGKALQAETIVDEITAQARAASFLYPQADTVFEIGGQDSKYISLRNGQVTDFQMNKVCAAGTGSFIEEQAGRLGLDLEDIGPASLKGTNPTVLGERCTVLMESKIASELSRGASVENICAGLCRSIVNNYLNRVVVNKKIGECICLQGGTMHNQGIVSAFYEKFGNRIRLIPYFDVTGAYGAALEASEQVLHREGDREENTRVYKKDREWFLAGYQEKLEPGKKIVGIPRALMLYKFFPMAYQYFRTLGYQVLLSKDTDEEIIGLGQETCQEETCYPVKLLHGHMEYLIRRGADYLFTPCVRTIKHAVSNVKHNYGCVYMQTAPVLAAKTLNLEERGVELLAPVLDLDMGQPQMVKAMLQLGTGLGHSKALCMAALGKGAAAMKRCEENSENLGKKIMDSLKPEDKILVLITRNYGIADPVLNMGIPEALLKRGCKVLNLAHLQGHSLDLSGEYPNLYWPFAQHILSGARIIKDHPNLYAVYLTNHGCGPDTMIAHLFAEIMGDKPYLSIEVDEHQSNVGVITRIEAFLNSLSHTENKRKQDYEVFLPSLSVYTQWISRYLEQIGFWGEGSKVKALPELTEFDLKAGKAESISKEDCVFSGILGQSLNLASQRKRYLQILPQTEGAETEGFTAQVVCSVLKKRGWNPSVSSPFIESFLESAQGEQIWFRLLLGDGFVRLIPEKQKEIMENQDFSEKMQQHLTWTQVRELLESWKPWKVHGKEVEIFGDPVLLYQPLLNRNLFQVIRSRGMVPCPMSLSEYCWYWLKSAGKEVPQACSMQLEWFLKDWGALEEGVFLEEKYLRIKKMYPSVTGGNITYLCSRSDCMEEAEKPGILLTPAYGNYGAVIELMRGRRCSFFHFEVDGNGEPEELERLDIFLELIK